MTITELIEKVDFQSNLTNIINNYIASFQNIEHLSLLILNILLFVNAKRIVGFFETEEKKIKIKTSIFRVFNILFLLFHLTDIALVYLNPDYQNTLFKIAISGIILYVSYFIHLLSSSLNKKIYGETSEIDGKKTNIETYSSKLTNIIVDISISFITLIILIKFWGFSSLLETTGIIGLFIGFAALTATIWAPDILNGLILLNHKLFEEGDIIVVEGEPYIVFKFGYTRVTLLNIMRNIRTSVKNTILSEEHIDNLTKPASTRGMRESLSFNIGYPADTETDKDKRLENFNIYKKSVLNMFQEAYDEGVEDETINLSEKECEFEIFLTSAGDYALEWKVSFYITPPKKTNTTSKARNYLNNANLVNEKIIKMAHKHNIDLATPMLQNINLKTNIKAVAVA